MPPVIPAARTSRRPSVGSGRRPRRAGVLKPGAARPISRLSRCASFALPSQRCSLPGRLHRADLFAVLPDAVAPNAPGSVTLSAELLRPPATPSLRDPERLQRLWRAAGETYDVPWQVLAAINAVESDFGRHMGPSSAGALGWMQFMPATWVRWGVDADGDGVANPWVAEDAVYAAARYLAAAGGTRNVSRAIFAYNHAGWYVDRVLKLAAVYEAGGTELAFGLDRLAVDLAAARARLAEASQLLEREQAARAPAGRSVANRTAQGARQARLASLEAAVTAARAAADRLQSSAAGASFSPATAASLGAPLLVGGYAFPVGGGPGTVSVPAGHHDYPAADIAAPGGSPVYALMAGTIERSWQSPDPRCGIGLLLRTGDGRGWVYCHLAVLDPAAVTGARVSAGTQLGLVGATGEATGPHLHLQLERADAWPQREAWFTAFAGQAFAWQGGVAPAATSSGLGGFTPVGSGGDVFTFTR